MSFHATAALISLDSDWVTFEGMTTTLSENKVTLDIFPDLKQGRARVALGLSP